LGFYHYNPCFLELIKLLLDKEIQETFPISSLHPTLSCSLRSRGDRNAHRREEHPLTRSKGQSKGSSSTRHCLCYRVSVLCQPARLETTERILHPPPLIWKPQILFLIFCKRLRFAAFQPNSLRGSQLNEHDIQDPQFVSTPAPRHLESLPDFEPLSPHRPKTPCHAARAHTLTAAEPGAKSPAQRTFKLPAQVAAVPPASAEFRPGSRFCGDGCSGGSAVPMAKHLIFLPPRCGRADAGAACLAGGRGLPAPSDSGTPLTFNSLRWKATVKRARNPKVIPGCETSTH